MNSKLSKQPQIREDSMDCNKNLNNSRPDDPTHKSIKKHNPSEQSTTSTNPQSSPKNSFKKAWNLNEDTKLVRLVVMNGPQNWDIISQSTNNRSGK